jgi:hypothetical protein
MSLISAASISLDSTFKQCCGSMTFWGGSGSGSADPCLFLMDPDNNYLWLSILCAILALVDHDAFRMGIRIQTHGFKVMKCIPKP